MEVADSLENLAVTIDRIDRVVPVKSVTFDAVFLGIVNSTARDIVFHALSGVGLRVKPRLTEETAFSSDVAA